MEIFYMLLIFVVLFFLISTGFAYLAVNRMKYSMDVRHRAAEVIVNFRRAPKSWAYETSKMLRKIPHHAKRTALEQKGKESCLKRLSQLIEYFKEAPVFDDETARAILLEQLRDVYEIWKREEWQQIVDGTET